MRKIPARKRTAHDPTFAASAANPTRHAIAYRGTPIGQADFVAAGLVTVDLMPLDAYPAVRDLIREASEVLWAMGFFGYRGANVARMPEDVLARAASLELEIRDAHGDLVHADWVNIIERPGPVPAPILVARFRLEPGGVPAAPAPATDADRHSEADA